MFQKLDLLSEYKFLLCVSIVERQEIMLLWSEASAFNCSVGRVNKEWRVGVIVFPEGYMRENLELLLSSCSVSRRP